MANAGGDRHGCGTPEQHAERGGELWGRACMGAERAQSGQCNEVTITTVGMIWPSGARTAATTGRAAAIEKVRPDAKAACRGLAA